MALLFQAEVQKPKVIGKAPATAESEKFKRDVERAVNEAFWGNNIGTRRGEQIKYDWRPGEKKTIILSFTTRGLLTITAPSASKDKARLYNSPDEMNKFIAKAINSVLESRGIMERVKLSGINSIYNLSSKDGKTEVYSVHLPYEACH